jgi:Lrp/AsnC family transcriptional regulator, leucine-responsive regulatory protein
VDSIDRRILYELARDARQTNADLADRIGLSASACLRRVRHLEESGAIRGYTAVIDPSEVDRGTLVIIQGSLERADRPTVERFKLAVAQRTEIVFCALMLSRPDVMMHVRVKDMAEYETLYLDVLALLPGITRLESQLVIDIVTEQAPVTAV